MRYRIEFVYGEPKKFIVHLSEKLMWSDEEGWLVFEFTDGGVRRPVEGEIPRYVIDILNLEGIESVEVRPHSLLIRIAELTTFNRVWGSIAYLLALNIAGDPDDIEEGGSPFVVAPNEKGDLVRKAVVPRQVGVQLTDRSDGRE
ncbi:MAG: hypothetical protein WDZ79_00900 [Candidatus Paceibacterota bacterium]